jgi:mono/diheme cytochrome c family protein
MISPRMRRPVKVLLTLGAALAVALATGACGEQWISVPKSNPALYHGAVLFNQRCAGCHSLSYAGARGSAQFVRTKQYNNGPNFNIRCERPVARVLYAIENGGFSGQIMPQNIVVGRDATDVARFVATYAGRQAPPIPGTVPCEKLPVGTIPLLAAAATSAGATGSAGAAGSTGSTGATGTSTSANPYQTSTTSTAKSTASRRRAKRH